MLHHNFSQRMEVALETLNALYRRSYDLSIEDAKVALEDYGLTEDEFQLVLENSIYPNGNTHC